MKENFGGKDIIDREIAAVYLYQKPIDLSELRLQEEEVEAVCWMDFEELKAHSEAGDPDFCIFAWEIGALEDGFRMAGLTETCQKEGQAEAGKEAKTAEKAQTVETEM